MLLNAAMYDIIKTKAVIEHNISIYNLLKKYFYGVY